jgi:hypothetical protein
LSKSSFHPKITDKTCCVHAEERASFDALMSSPTKILDSRLYFVQVDKDGNQQPSGNPYCTICSKIILDIGISEFVLRHEDGIYVYDAEKYNDLSFNYE